MAINSQICPYITEEKIFKELTCIIIKKEGHDGPGIAHLKVIALMPHFFFFFFFFFFFATQLEDISMILPIIRARIGRGRKEEHSCEINFIIING